jgi:UDP:flavonoid glycosyltransferase YjiC (YdhE family)
MADLLSASAQQHVDIVEDVDDHGKILGLSQEQVAILQEQAITWAAAHGLLVRYNTPQVNQKNSAVFTHIPFCLLPIPVSILS